MPLLWARAKPDVSLFRMRRTPAGKLGRLHAVVVHDDGPKSS